MNYRVTYSSLLNTLLPLQCYFAGQTNGFLQLQLASRASLEARHQKTNQALLLRMSTDADNSNRLGLNATDETADSMDEPSTPQVSISINSNSNTKTSDANNNNNKGGGPGLLTGIFASAVLLFFAVTAFVPLFEVVSTAPAANSNLGNSVVTRQDADAPTTTAKKNFESKFDALSKTKIQDKLSNLPVFYLVRDGKMLKSIYFSFDEARDASKDVSAELKVTTLDQVLYPLILEQRQGTMKMVSTAPKEIKQAILRDTETQYTLIPSAAALKDAQETNTILQQNDAPIFVVERLAFASNNGPQVPLFLEKNDAILSYNRLRESGGNKLPAEPVVRTSSLLDVLDGMERGTRPGVSQLAFYGNAENVLKADEMSQYLTE